MTQLNYVAEAAIAALAEHVQDPAYIADKRESFEGLGKQQAFCRAACIFDSRVWDSFMARLAAEHETLAENSRAAKSIAQLLAQL